MIVRPVINKDVLERIEAIKPDYMPMTVFINSLLETALVMLEKDS